MATQAQALSLEEENRQLKQDMLEIWAMFQKTAERSGALAIRLGLPAGMNEPEGEVMDGLKREGEKLE